LHLDLSLSDLRNNLPEYQNIIQYQFELQIRTIVQDSWSVLDHKIKYKKSIPERLKRRINTLAALFELADREFKEIRDKTLQIEKQEQEAELDLEKEFKNEQTYEDSALGGQTYLFSLKNREHQLNVFSFYRIAHHFFHDYQFEPHKIDGFTQEIIKFEPSISRGKFNSYMTNSISKVKEYKNYFENANPHNSLNPYTVIRHCLYLSNKETFKNILMKTRYLNLYLNMEISKIYMNMKIRKQ